MDPATLDACVKMASRLKRRTSLKAFAETSKEALVKLDLYMDRVEHPLDITSIEKALKAGEVASPAAFVRLMRRVASNCLRFCIDKPTIQLRGQARRLLEAVDKEVEEQPLLKGTAAPLRADVFVCLDVVDKLLPDPEVTAFWVRLEIWLRKNPSRLQAYRDTVAFPMDMGRLTAELLEDGISAAEFLGKTELVFRNCMQFWASTGEDDTLVSNADRYLGAVEKEASTSLPDAWRDRFVPPVDAGHPPPSKRALLNEGGAPKPRPLITVPKLDATRMPSVTGPFTIGGTGGNVDLKPPPQLQLTVSSGGMGVPRPTVATAKPRMVAPAPVLKMEGGGGGDRAGAKPLQLKKTFSTEPGGLLREASSSSLLEEDGASNAMPFPPPLEKRTSSTASGLKLKSLHVITETGDSSHGGQPLRSPSGQDLSNQGALPDDNSRSNSAFRAGTPGVTVASSPKISIAVKAPQIKVIARSDSTGSGMGGGGGGGVVPLKLPPHGALRPSPPPGAAVVGQKRKLGGQDNTHGDAPFSASVATAVAVAKQKQQFDVTSTGQPPPALLTRQPSTGPTTLKLKLGAKVPVPASTALGPPVFPPPADHFEESQDAFVGGRARKRDRSSVSPNVKAERGGGGKKGGGGGGKKKKGSTDSPNQEPPPEWYLPCKGFVDKIVKAVERLGTVAGGKKDRYDFKQPVIERFPNVKDAYLSKIARPMALSTVTQQLKKYASPKAFLQDMDLIFANAIQFNSDVLLLSPYEQEVVVVAKYMRRYVDTLALESLPLEEEYHPDEPLNLSWQRRDKVRQQLEEMATTQLASPANFQTIRELINQLKSERKVGDFFLNDVDRATNPGYYAVIAQPTSFKTIAKHFEAGSMQIGQVVAELRLVYQNALLFNSPAETTVPLSRQICDAARLLQRKLDEKLPMFYLHIWEIAEREAGLRETLTALRVEGEKQAQAQAAAEAAALEVHGQGNAGGVTFALPSPNGAAVAPSPRGGMMMVSSPVPGLGDGTAAPGPAQANKLRREKRREAELDKKAEEKKRKEREAKLKECITQEVWARVEQERARLLAQPPAEHDGQKMEVEELAPALGGTGDARNEPKVPLEGAFGALDLSHVGRGTGKRRGRPVRRLLAELLKTATAAAVADAAAPARKDMPVKELEAQLASVPPPENGTEDEGEEEEADDDASTSSSSSSSYLEVGDIELERWDGDDGKGNDARRIRLLVQVVHSPSSVSVGGREELHGHPLFPVPPLVHVTVLADAEEPGDLPEEGPRGGGGEEAPKLPGQIPEAAAAGRGRERGGRTGAHQGGAKDSANPACRGGRGAEAGRQRRGAARSPSFAGPCRWQPRGPLAPVPLELAP